MPFPFMVGLSREELQSWPSSNVDHMQLDKHVFHTTI